MTDLLERQPQSKPPAVPSTAHRLARASLILFLVPTLLSAMCLIPSLFNLSTQDQEDLIALTGFGVFVCGVPVVLLWIKLGVAWLNARIRQTQTSYHCTRDDLVFTLNKPLNPAYRLLYGVCLMPLIVCALMFVLLRQSTRPGATPAPYPGAELVISPVAQGGGSGGIMYLRDSFYSIAQPRSVLQDYYAAQFSSFSLPGWTVTEETPLWNKSQSCLNLRGKIKRMFPYQYHYLSVLLCASGEQKTEVHINEQWNK